MEQPTRGRHRQPPVRRSLPLAAALVGAVVLVGATVVVTAGLTGGSADREPSPAGGSTAPVSPATAPGQGDAELSATRDVTVRRDVVTVVETATVVDGEDVAVSPAATASDPALALVRVQLLAEDGTLSPFSGPVSLSAGRTVAVQGTYRLRSCPDLLPTAWPSPMVVEGTAWSRSYSRTSEPLRTAPTLCPGSRPAAEPLPGLSARLSDTEGAGRPPSVRVRLRWDGPGGLAVDTVGALSDLAALPLVVHGEPGRCPARGCIGSIGTGGRPGPGGLPLDVQPVEACPNRAPRPDRLTLQVRVGDGVRQLVVVEVPGLGRWLARTVCR